MRPAPSVRHATRAHFQASHQLAESLGWHLDSSGDAGEVDAEACTDRIQAVLQRAEYHARGQKAARDAGKGSFEPDWTAVVRTVREGVYGANIAKDEAAQADVAQCMVWHQCGFNDPCLLCCRHQRAMC